MSDEKKTPHSLATFLRGPAPAPEAKAQAEAGDADTPPPHASTAAGAQVPPSPADAPVPAVEQTPPASSPAPWEQAPRFTRAARTNAVQRRTPPWQWAVLAALALVLAMQVLLADRARLAADATWRPVLAALCAALRCELPAWHEPAAFTMLNREVRPAPDQRGVLQVQASFRNDARWAQAWPYLQLSLSDADGRVIGSRVFSPREYLGHPVPPGDTLAPGQGTQIAFRVREPAASTAAFGFEFH
ncbi:MAG: DUF3426 domain-containing protein [Gammaproteobacteria bacterium]